ncbi:RNA polymerase, sigma-24 subunit, ECF subfamily [Catenulispora acidiphila DSM 44928]|uniref:RNA polymerase, sigma-24 subunit, ECF subfamily n=1 Tax=Catenulispora acidiphila (strain DSM 44928 / JCM 14897 / NBRC 102108 / NRRL B-24433 / ID139908) TaxID=479433 RepID=C7Q8P7_CATAD|nr:RNA polymerase, sigma-24 subunit, ECF subfamily [Catenulispora acidiphila DSM 44928]
MKEAQEESFREFVEGSWSRLLRTAYLLTADHGAAEDLVQVALMRTYRHWDRIEAYESPEGYVRRAMVNANISAWRRRKHVVHVMAEPPERPAESGDHQDAYAVRDELWRAVCAMSPRMRTVFVLRYFEDLTEAETAAVMGCAVGTVKSQIARGLTKLRGELRAEGSLR